MPLIQFIGALVGAGVMVSFASLIWPKVTSDPRPPALTRVRETVIHTQLGWNAAQVLGVADEAGVEPVSVGELVAQGANAAVTSVVETTKQTVTSQLLRQLAGQFGRLSEEEKEAFRAEICQPQPASESAVPDTTPQ